MVSNMDNLEVQIPICPKCKVGTRRTQGVTVLQTMSHTPKVYDANGILENPDVTIVTTKWKCLDCETEYEVSK